MLDVFIDYNPYKVETKIVINGTPVTEQSPLYNPTNEQRLQSWIEPHGAWEGIFTELRKQGEHSVLIRFHGTALDYADLEYARDRYGNVFKEIKLEHVNRETCQGDDPVEKLHKLKDLYEELQNGPVDEFKTADIRRNFENAINSDFEIVVIAPMSSGKSTLINAILGQDLLPAINKATTATIVKIRAVNNPSGSKDFTVTATRADGQFLRLAANPDGTLAEDVNGNFICSSTGKAVEKIAATPKLIKQLNDLKDPASSEARALVDTMWIEGPIESITGSGENGLNTVLVDTPGGNSAINRAHEAIMNKAICDENKSLILYVFNGTQTETKDSNHILESIAKEMKHSNGGKQSRDRFLFAANRMDDIDPERESFESFQDTIGAMLSNNGIQGPNLFFLSAELAKLIRVQRTGQGLTKQDRSFLEGKKTLFGDMSDGDDSYCLYKYSSISDRQRAEYDEGLERLTDPYRIAEINSGVPALEAAIREYVDKYAVSIKLKHAHDSFMNKVIEREMIDSQKAKWASSQEELRKVQADICAKRQTYENDKRLSEFRNQIERVQVDQRYSEEMEIHLREEADNIRNRYGSKIKREHAQVEISEFQGTVERCLKRLWAELTEYVNEGAVRACNQVLREYQECIKAMEDGGLFDLGGINVKRLEAFRNINMRSYDDLLEGDKYSFFQQEKVGTRTYERSGFFAKVKRFFGFKSGWGTEDIMEDVEYIDMQTLVNDTIQETMENLFLNEVRGQNDRVYQEIAAVKEAALEKLNRVDEQMRKLLDKLSESVSNEERLKAEVAANQGNLEWMEGFISRMDAILEIQ